MKSWKYNQDKSKRREILFYFLDPQTREKFPKNKSRNKSEKGTKNKFYSTKMKKRINLQINFEWMTEGPYSS